MKKNKLQIIRNVRIELSNIKESKNFAEYPWDECIADQVARYGDEETAKKVCGAIKAGMQKSFQEGDSLEGACWPGYEAIGLKDLNGRLVPNCVPIKEEMKKIVKEGFPVPSPEAGEKESDFMGRCMSAISGEYPQDQAVAICLDTWRKG